MVMRKQSDILHTKNILSVGEKFIISTKVKHRKGRRRMFLMNSVFPLIHIPMLGLLNISHMAYGTLMRPGWVTDERVPRPYRSRVHLMIFCLFQKK